jgi:signal transduction histidine kinase
MKTEIEVALREKKLSETEAKSLLTSNLEEVTKLEALSNNLLRLAQYSAGQREVKWEPTKLETVVDEALRRTRPAAQIKQIKMAAELRPHEFEAQPESLTELLVILLDNAVKYGRPDTAITVSGGAHGSQLELRVKDEGIGIAPDDLPHIFDRFYRADSSRSKQNVEGYGLGLSIAKQIAELHHGHIEAQSALGHGTTFIIRLPLKQPHRRLSL